MQMNVHSPHFKADAKLVDFIRNRMEKLENFHHDFIAADVFLRLDKNKERGNKITVVKIKVPGKDLVAKRQASSFEESTDLVMEALRRQIKKLKGKRAVA